VVKARLDRKRRAERRYFSAVPSLL
jgi:hypothetical protein